MQYIENKKRFTKMLRVNKNINLRYFVITNQFDKRMQFSSHNDVSNILKFSIILIQTIVIHEFDKTMIVLIEKFDTLIFIMSAQRDVILIINQFFIEIFDFKFETHAYVKAHDFCIFYHIIDKNFWI